MICQNCIHSEVCKHKSESVYECEHFKDGTIKNQYDRIRNMSVEELAKFICENFVCGCHFGGCPDYQSSDGYDIQEVKRRLESEVTE